MRGHVVMLAHRRGFVRQPVMPREPRDLHREALRHVERGGGIGAARVEQVDVEHRRIALRLRRQRYAQAERAARARHQIGRRTVKQRRTVGRERPRAGDRDAVLAERRSADRRAGRERQRCGIGERPGGRRAAVECIADRAGRCLRRQRDVQLAAPQRIAARPLQAIGHGKGAVGDLDPALPPAQHLRPQPRDEPRKVTRRGRPGRLGERRRAREDGMLHLIRRDEIFAPRIALRAEHVLCLGGIDPGGHRLIGVDIGERLDRQAAGRLVGLIALQAVEIQRRRGRQHDVVPLVGGIDRALLATPRHHRGGRRQAAFEDLVPADQPPPLAREIAAERVDHPALQRILVLETERLHLRLDARRALPLILDRFVATEMDEAAGEDGDQFVEHILDKRHALGAGIEQIRIDAPIVAHHRPVAEHAHFGIGGDQSLRMARQVDLGNDRDAALGGVAHQRAQFGLGVEASDSRRRCRATRAGPLPPRADLGQLGIALDLEAPALVVGEMQMERVELHRRHLVDDPVERRQRLKMSRGIDHQSAPGKARRIANVEQRHRDRTAARAIGAEQLRQRHRAIDQPGMRRRGNADAVRINREPITLRADHRRIALEADRRGVARQAQREAACAGDLRDQQLRRAFGIRVARRNTDPRPSSHDETASAANDAGGHGKQRQRRLLGGEQRRGDGCRRGGETSDPSHGALALAARPVRHRPSPIATRQRVLLR